MRVKKHLKLIPVALACIQGVLWLSIGNGALYEKIPEMIEMDVADAVRHQAELVPPEALEPRGTGTFVVCDQLASSIGRVGLTALQNTFQSLEYSVIPEHDAPVGWKSDGVTKEGFTELCAYIEWSTPLVADVEIVWWNGPLAANGFGHRAWFVLGFWVPISAHSIWVS
jgi:hypothetical protein